MIPEVEIQQTFALAEKEMVRGVLTLADRPVQNIMTPRREVNWIDADDSNETMLAKIRGSAHRLFLVSRGDIDDVLGFARKEDIFELLLQDKTFDLIQIIRQPLALRDGVSILQTLDLFKQTPVEMALVVDEYGGLQGIVTQTDILEAIAGDLPRKENQEPEVSELADGSLLLDGAMTIYDAKARLQLESLPPGDFHTLAGLLLFLFARIPAVDERVDWGGWSFHVSDVEGLRLNKVIARRIDVGGNAEDL